MQEMVEEYGHMVVAVILAVFVFTLLYSMISPNGMLRELVIKFYESAGSVKVV